MMPGGDDPQQHVEEPDRLLAALAIGRARSERTAELDNVMNPVGSGPVGAPRVTIADASVEPSSSSLCASVKATNAAAVPPK